MYGSLKSEARGGFDRISGEYISSVVAMVVS